MNREEAPGKSPEEMYIQQKVRVLLMLKKMGSNLTPSEEAFLRNYAGVVHSQMSQLPQHNIDQGTSHRSRGDDREEAPGKSPEEMYIQQKVRVLLMLKKMGSNLTPSEEAFLRNYAGVVHSQMSQLPQHNIDQGAEDVVMAFSRSETEDRRQ
ncbi:beta-catenin-interacting protein 1 [Osmerus mordax]|uniref:beta-catenin-interacting protein 1 n=1 Tax=Osmerus mordax TaxID=8014 RepID=UPI0035106034